MKAYRINVAQPCSENWDQMKSAKDGRFCLSCQKNVVDFTRMKDEEIVAYLLLHSNTCGRFYNDQLDRSVYYSLPVKARHYHWPAIAAFLVAGLFSVAPAFSQTPIQKTVYPVGIRRDPPLNTEMPKLPEAINSDPVVENKQDSSQTKAFTLTGTAIDKETGEPLGFSTIIVMIDEKVINSVTADTAGYFSITLPPNVSDSSVTLKANMVGYAPKTLSINSADLEKPLIIELTYSRVLMSGMVIMTVEKTIEPITPSPGPGSYNFNSPGFN